MALIKFFVPGHPIGKERPRIVSNKNYVSPTGFMPNRNDSYYNNYSNPQLPQSQDKHSSYKPASDSTNKKYIVYTPKQTKQYEEEVGWRCRSAMGNQALFSKPCGLIMKIFVCHHYEEAPYVSLATKRRPDIDNVAKSIMDGCNKIAYDDDKQIHNLIVEEVFAEETGVCVSIRPMRPRMFNSKHFIAKVYKEPLYIRKEVEID